MVNRQLYTIKFESSRLKKSNYCIENLTFEQAKKNQEIISVGENQIIRTINDIIVKNNPNMGYRTVDREKLESYYKNIERLKRSKNKEKKTDTLIEIEKNKQNIINMCFIPEYITVVMNHDTHYEYMFNNGFKVNGKIFKRLSVSAGQGRVKTVVFCDESIIDDVNAILDNGRNTNIPFSPSKFSAYKGLYGSATKIVTTPKFCVIPDYESESTFTCNWVTETKEDEDDKIEIKEITRSYNRFDGMGLISPALAKQWADDLGLDYIPAEFCIRQSFTKGMVAVFDHKLFGEKFSNGNYIVKDVYGDDIDLREVDLILTESQFKLKKCFKSVEEFRQNCEINNLKWGVSLYTDKELKHKLKMNYQFFGAMDIKKDRIPELCHDFVEWIRSVNKDDIISSLLFLVGEELTEEGLKSYLNSGDNWWIKALIINNDLINDKYFKQKIYNLIKTKIENSYIGGFFVDGNNQTLVSDPFGLAQHLYGLEVTGLLGKNEYYSKYWIDKNVDTIVGMRPPLTYRAETLKMNVVEPNNVEGVDWYEYLYGGIIVNIHGSETDYWAGSDWDYDFLSTTSNKVIVESLFENEYPICYEAPKVNPIIFTDYDLYISDTFTFGSIIGSITNKGTSGHALLPYIEQKYGVDSKHYETLLNRVKMTCKLQSAQIDKAKIGRNVKEIPKVWTDRRYIMDNFKGEERDMLLELMLDRHPYFFIYLYTETKSKYKNHITKSDMSCQHKFGITLDKLLELDELTEEQQLFVENFNKYMPVINNDCVMNNICKYLESVNFDIKKNTKHDNFEDLHLLLMRNDDIFNREIYSEVLKECKNQIKNMADLRNINANSGKRKFDSNKSNSTELIYKKFEESMEKVCPNVNELTDCLIRIFYVDMSSFNKDILWNIYGKYIVENLRDKSQSEIKFPLLSKGGDIDYLGRKYELKEIGLPCSIMK